jgi:preprotein translocase subunit SecA
MMEKINKEIVSFLIKANLPSGSKVENEQVQQNQQLKMGRSDNYSGNKRNQQKRVEPVRVEQKVGRNEACPCGSGKKYKQCHGK